MWNTRNTILIPRGCRNWMTWDIRNIHGHLIRQPGAGARKEKVVRNDNPQWRALLKPFQRKTPGFPTNGKPGAFFILSRACQTLKFNWR